MRFFRFLAALNVFATIRNLREELTAAQYLNSLSADTIGFLRAHRDAYRDRCAVLVEAVEQADQALNTFMDEREGLTAAIDAFMYEREDHKVDLALAHGAGIMVTASLIQTAQEADQQTRETLEVISYVKQVEARLAAAGITIADGDNNVPVVTVDQESFVQAVRKGYPNRDAGTVQLAA